MRASWTWEAPPKGRGLIQDLKDKEDQPGVDRGKEHPQQRP